MANKKAVQLRPLKRFDYKLVEKRLEGLSFNLDRDLQNKLAWATVKNQEEEIRCLSLLLVMLRFAFNAYNAVRYIAADTPADPRRKPTFVLVVPNVNRQLLDLLFSLVYMLDDFPSRSLTYQRAGWRELVEEKQQFKSSFASDPEWKVFFSDVDRQLALMVQRFSISPEEVRNPSSTPFWKTPYQLLDEKTPSRTFLKYLEKWIYKDVSAQTHLGFGGLQKVSNFLVTDLLGDQVDPALGERALQSFHFQQVSRTAVAFLALATEVDTYCRLNNEHAVDYLWVIFSEFVPEAKELYELRYQKRSRLTQEVS